MVEKMSAYKLNGLEADNLLTFLALLGLLRALDVSQPQWLARLHWAGMPLTATLTVVGNVDRATLLQAVEDGVGFIAPFFSFDESKDIAFSQGEFRELCEQWATAGEQLGIIAALGSDGSLKRGSDKIEPTPYCAIFGQGHQHFLLRLRDVIKVRDTPFVEVLEQALFEEWQYGDRTPSFRWDPLEDRRYALQAGNPSEERNKIGTVAGANTLAAIGFGVLTTVPSSGGLEALGVAGRRGAKILCWPLPGLPTSLSGYKALLQHPALLSDSGASVLALYGIAGVARARRIQVGKYFNFERAVITLEEKNS